MECRYLVYYITTLLIATSSIHKVSAQHIRVIDSVDFKSKKDIVDVFQDWKITDSIAPKPKRVGNAFQVSLLPTVAGIPGNSGVAFVTMVSAAFLLGPPQTTNLSNIYFTPYTNFKGKFVFPIRSYIWSKNNKWNFIGDYRYMIYPETTYGLGSDSKASDQTLVNYKFFRFHQSLLRKVFSYFVAGGGVRFDYHYDMEEATAEVNQKYIELYDTPPAATSSSNGLSLSGAYDSRLNSVNPQQGMYAGLTYSYIPTWLGSTYNWQSIYTDVRLYHSFNRRRQNLISFWAFYWTVFAGKAPYLDLPSTMWDPNYRSGRGYYQGRYRGDAMAYIEGEYRFDLTKNGLWGATVYANAQSLRDPSTGTFGLIAPGAGMGLRLKFNKFSNTNLTFDAGVGKESWNYYFGIGEFF